MRVLSRTAAGEHGPGAPGADHAATRARPAPGARGPGCAAGESTRHDPCFVSAHLDPTDSACARHAVPISPQSSGVKRTPDDGRENDRERPRPASLSAVRAAVNATEEGYPRRAN